MYVLNFQNIQRGWLGASKKDIDKLVETVMEAFNLVANNKFALVRTHQYDGMLQIFVAAKEVLPRISDVFSCSVATGMIYYGSGTCLRFACDDSTFCFMNVNVSPAAAAATVKDLT